MRRPTISPNFNFLGQLVEFDSQLTKQRSDDAASSVLSTTQTTSESPPGVCQMNLEVPERAPSPSKRPCMINLSHVVESRRSLNESVDGGVVTVQSPTVALSRLQFVEQRQASSAAAVNVSPASTVADSLVTPSPPSIQSKPTADSAAVAQQVISSSPSSMSSSSAGTDVSASHSKTSRSMSLSQGTQQHQDQQKLPSSSSWSHQSTSSTRGGESTAVIVDTEQSSAANTASVTADMLLVDWQTSLKSRSLEDILLVSTTPPPRSLGHGQGHVTSHWTPAEESAHESPRLNGHASLHGSLEMIQVS